MDFLSWMPPDKGGDDERRALRNLTPDDLLDLACGRPIDTTRDNSEEAIFARAQERGRASAASMARMQEKYDERRKREIELEEAELRRRAAAERKKEEEGVGVNQLPGAPESLYPGLNEKPEYPWVPGYNPDAPKLNIDELMSSPGDMQYERIDPINSGVPDLMKFPAPSVSDAEKEKNMFLELYREGLKEEQERLRVEKERLESASRDLREPYIVSAANAREMACGSVSTNVPSTDYVVPLSEERPQRIVNDSQGRPVAAQMGPTDRSKEVVYAGESSLMVTQAARSFKEIASGMTPLSDRDLCPVLGPVTLSSLFMRVISPFQKPFASLPAFDPVDKALFRRAMSEYQGGGLLTGKFAPRLRRLNDWYDGSANVVTEAVFAITEGEVEKLFGPSILGSQCVTFEVRTTHGRSTVVMPWSFGRLHSSYGVAVGLYPYRGSDFFDVLCQFMDQVVRPPSNVADYRDRIDCHGFPVAPTSLYADPAGLVRAAEVAVSSARMPHPHLDGEACMPPEAVASRLRLNEEDYPDASFPHLALSYSESIRMAASESVKELIVRMVRWLSYEYTLRRSYLMVEEGKKPIASSQVMAMHGIVPASYIENIEGETLIHCPPSLGVLGMKAQMDLSPLYRVRKSGRLMYPTFFAGMRVVESIAKHIIWIEDGALSLASCITTSRGHVRGGLCVVVGINLRDPGLREVLYRANAYSVLTFDGYVIVMTTDRGFRYAPTGSLTLPEFRHTLVESSPPSLQVVNGEYIRCSRTVGEMLKALAADYCKVYRSTLLVADPAVPPLIEMTGLEPVPGVHEAPKAIVHRSGITKAVLSKAKARSVRHFVLPVNDLGDTMLLDISSAVQRRMLDDSPPDDDTFGELQYKVHRVPVGAQGPAASLDHYIAGLRTIISTIPHSEGVHIAGYSPSDCGHTNSSPAEATIHAISVLARALKRNIHVWTQGMDWKPRGGPDAGFRVSRSYFVVSWGSRATSVAYENHAAEVDDPSPSQLQGSLTTRATNSKKSPTTVRGELPVPGAAASQEPAQVDGKFQKIDPETITSISMAVQTEISEGGIPPLAATRCPREMMVHSVVDAMMTCACSPCKGVTGRLEVGADEDKHPGEGVGDSARGGDPAGDRHGSSGAKEEGLHGERSCSVVKWFVWSKLSLAPDDRRPSGGQEEAIVQDAVRRIKAAGMPGADDKEIDDKYCNPRATGSNLATSPRPLCERNDPDPEGEVLGKVREALLSGDLTVVEGIDDPRFRAVILRLAHRVLGAALVRVAPHSRRARSQIESYQSMVSSLLQEADYEAGETGPQPVGRMLILDRTDSAPPVYDHGDVHSYLDDAAAGLTRPI